MGRREGVIMGDWNAHHRAWADKGDTLMQDGRGVELRAWQRAGQWVLAGPDGPTWEREVEGRWRRTTIDLAFHRGVQWEPVRGTKFSADHWTIGGSMDIGIVESNSAYGTKKLISLVISLVASLQQTAWHCSSLFFFSY